MRLQYLERYRRVGGIFLLIIGCFFPHYVQAQYGGFDQEDTGFGLWINVENLSIDPATDDSKTKDRAYLDVLPSSMINIGLGLGISFNQFGFSIGLSRADASVGQDADVQQNDDSSDDLEVKNAVRFSQTWSIQSNLFFPLYFGLGEDQGNFEFSVKTPEDRNQIRTTGFFNQFLIFGIVIDSELATSPNVITLLSNIYVKVPYQSHSYSGTVLGIAVTGALN